VIRTKRFRWEGRRFLEEDIPKPSGERPRKGENRLQKELIEEDSAFVTKGVAAMEAERGSSLFWVYTRLGKLARRSGEKRLDLYKNLQQCS